MSEHETAGRRRRHLVRPRWVWGGLVIALLGACVLGLGVSRLSWSMSIFGTVLLLVGAVGSLHGGVLYDAVPGFALRKEMRQVREGDVHEGVAPGDTVSTPAARRDAIRSNQITRELEAAAGHPGHVAWAPVAGWVLLLVVAVLVMSQWELVAHTATGRSNSFRDTGLAIVLGLAGLRLAVTPGRHSIAAGVTMLAGLALILGGLLADHDHVGLVIVEVTSGLLAMLCSLIAWIFPKPGPRELRG